MIERTPLYQPTRDAYRRIFKPQFLLSVERMGAFYSQFFQPGETVFDVGANQGEYSEVFAKEGAQVIAVEPNPAFRSRLTAMSRFQSITPEFVAVGDEPGEATLNVCSTSGFSTLLSSDSGWMKDSPDYANVTWVGQVRVPVLTLTQIAEKHGCPAFVKIDVEGFELQVLSGMAFTPRYISFEYGVRRKELALGCISLLAARGYRFRPIAGREFRFATPDWMTAEKAELWLGSRTPDEGEYGDLFAYLWN
jgi:FkbM family methyltransferase